MKLASGVVAAIEQVRHSSLVYMNECLKFPSLQHHTPDNRHHHRSPSILNARSNSSRTSDTPQASSDPDFSAHVASVLRNLQLQHFSHIEPREYCSFLQDEATGHFEIQEAERFNALITRWVMKAVLSPIDYIDRGERLKWFVFVAEVSIEQSSW